MITHVSTIVPDPWAEAEEADIIIVRYEPEEGKPLSKAELFLRRFLKWFGRLSMLALGAAALSPNTFNVPLNDRPWVFVIFIFWFVAFCAGFFNS